MTTLTAQPRSASSRPGARHDRPRLDVVAPRRGGARAGTLEVLALSCEAVSEVEPQALALTYWLDPAPAGSPYSTSVRFSGRRRTPGEKVGHGDTFSVEESLDVVPGTGPLAITTRVEGIRGGGWQVTATEVGPRRTRSGRGRPRPGAQVSAYGTTTYGPVASVLAPGAHLGAWPALVGLAWVVALVVQEVLAGHLGLREPLLLTLGASLVGLAGAKGYYAAGHFIRGERRLRQLLGGSCIQGFVLAAAASLVVGARVAHLPLGALLDSTAPALMFGMTIGRYGCFFGGCCAGRPTASHWGLWSSDRHIGVRRVPVQLLESSVALSIGITGFAVLWSTRPTPAGVLFVSSVAAYTLGRQLLFPLRDHPRYTAHGRLLVLAACAALVVATAAVGLGAL